MSRSFQDWVVEVSSTTGTGAYALGGAPAGTSYFTFRAKYGNGDPTVCYYVRNADRTKWEKNQLTTLTYGTPDSLSRNVVDSTNGGAAVSWVAGDLPLRIYVAPDSDAAEIAITMGFGTTRPDLLRYGLWIDEDGAAADVDLIKFFDGTSDISVARVDRNNHTFEWLAASEAGVVKSYAGGTVPKGNLACQGQAVSRSTYSRLFAVIGTTFGSGDGSTTFNVPDIAGRAVYGKETSATRLTGAISGINGNTLGAAGGDQRLHQHNHTDAGHSHTGSGAGWVGNNLANGTNRAVGTGDGVNAGAFQAVVVSINGAQAVINNTGFGTAQNLPPAIVLNYMISTGGVT